MLFVNLDGKKLHFILFRLPVVIAAAIVSCHTVWFTTLVTPGIDTKSLGMKAESSNH